METSDANTSIDVQHLIDRSMPRSGVPWFWYVLGLVLLTTLVTAYFAPDDESGGAIINTVSFGIMFLAIGVMMLLSWRAARVFREEQNRLQTAQELIRLRRWPDALSVLQNLLSRPMRAQPLRIQGLMDLSAVLMRYHLFDEAVIIHDYVLQNVQMSVESRQGLRTAKAMAMLRQDHLTDADRALIELRRDTREGDSAGLSLVEMYRDIKTGHPQEAIDLFAARFQSIRDEMGNRVADAYLLLAKAFDSLGDTDKAAAAYQDATILLPPVELHRRYPETRDLNGKYAPASWPSSMSNPQALVAGGER